MLRTNIKRSTGKWFSNWIYKFFTGRKKVFHLPKMMCMVRAVTIFCFTLFGTYIQWFFFGVLKTFNSLMVWSMMIFDMHHKRQICLSMFVEKICLFYLYKLKLIWWFSSISVWWSTVFFLSLWKESSWNCQIIIIINILHDIISFL